MALLSLRSLALEEYDSVRGELSAFLTLQLGFGAERGPQSPLTQSLDYFTSERLWHWKDEEITTILPMCAK